MIHIIIERSLPYIAGVVERFAQVTYLDHTEFTPESIADADALIIRSIVKCTPELLKGSKVKMIATATAGFDHIDTRYCEQNGIAWANAPGCNALSVAQYVMCCLARLNMRNGRKPGQQTLGIVGVGHVGKQVKRLAEAMGYRILLCDPPRALQEGSEGFIGLEDIAGQADIITFHVPLTKPEESTHPTYHMIETDFLEQCARKPIIINACRGAVTDTEALLAAKRRGLVSSLITDCWEGEPDINEDLLRLSDIATPHIAGFSADGKANGSRMALAAVCKHFSIDTQGYLETMRPGVPINSVIDLSYDHSHLIERALLATFDPIATDRTLRQRYETFEDQRKNYNFPREMSAFIVKGVPLELEKQFAALDFKVEVAPSETTTQEQHEN